VPVPARLARGGSAVWLLAFILSLALVLVQGLAYATFGGAGRPRSSSPASSADTSNDDDEDDVNDQGLMSRWYGYGFYMYPSLFLDLLRFVGSWLLWAGLLFTDETAFCPSRRTWARVTVIWLFVPFVDCLWRGFATFTEKKGEAREEADNLMI